MFQIDFNKPVNVHFIGIGGISMSGLAMILVNRGFRVSGSDAHESALTDQLAELGASITIGQSADNIKDDADLIVYTAAIREDNPEFQAARASGIPMMTRAQLLGQIMQNYEIPINVAGTHGKTTTTSLCSHILLSAGLDPTISVGGMLPAIGGNIRVGSSRTFIAEACEYTNSFLSFFPKIGLILNVDADHLDFFKDLDDIADSFHRFAALLPSDGTLIINRDTAKYDVVTRGLPCEIITYSLSGDADYTADDIVFDEKGCASFTAVERGKPLGSFSLRIPGIHNVSNALASIALGRKLGLSADVIRKGILDFHGADRRFQHKGFAYGAEIIDDYAHHPAEITATLHAAKRVPHKKLWVAFQPHTYTRTKALLPEFAEALALADHVVLADIYAAREINTIGISSDDLRKEIEARGTKADYFSSFEEIEAFLKSHLSEGDLLITMGAGNIVDVGEDLLRA
ncbi:MAG: UDP-N-acetylmuramate--L-alanine ligase [Lachnospiraceae bacterium]|nr:UDP-N-acetylmuramate--L-alanine ligase [Lachnospiraceae bacterium]